ncbi:hypothetical protein CHS0354_036332 [Potamilus streckersoni]|uniref:Uncharacterized protein n=1 Tax=Potamilus streckersoni TaxID=2493646 RepID=A0AAE0RM20_9BIVA|nr:hypothetical protein CHS0354_036332 [Potamilus streckersoni]
MPEKNNKLNTHAKTCNARDIEYFYHHLITTYYQRVDHILTSGQVPQPTASRSACMRFREITITQRHALLSQQRLLADLARLIRDFTWFTKFPVYVDHILTSGQAPTPTASRSACMRF